MKTMQDRRRSERRSNIVPIGFPDRRKGVRRLTAATILLKTGLGLEVDPNEIMKAELKNARWHTWGTFVNVLGVAVGLFSITLANRWGERLPAYGIAFMGLTVVAYAFMRVIAGRWEEKAIRLGQGQSR